MKYRIKAVTPVGEFYSEQTDDREALVDFLRDINDYTYIKLWNTFMTKAMIDKSVFIIEVV